MATTDVLGKVYETLLCSPGMNEAVKIDVRMNRKTVLLLSGMIETGLGKDDSYQSELIKLIPAEDKEELKVFADECLKKAGLKELSEKMRSLQ
jgi:hypothetical protein